MGWLDLQYRHRFIIAILLLVAALLPHGNAHAFSLSTPTNHIANVAESTGGFFCNYGGFLFSLFGLCENASNQQSVGPDTPSAPEPKSEPDDEESTPPPTAAAPQPATSSPQATTTRIIRETPIYVTNEYVTNPTTIIRETIERGGGGSNIDTADFVSRSLFDAQVQATHDSFSNSDDGITDSLAESITTDLLTVTGNGTLSGTFDVTGALTTSAYIFATDASATSTLRGALTVGTSTSRAALTLDGGLYLGSTTPTQTASRLYNQSGSLYWAGNIIAGASVGTWEASGGNVYRSTGNVGIGTDNPGGVLSVDSGDFSSERVIARFTYGSRNLDLLQPTVQSGNEPFTFSTNNAYAFRVDGFNEFVVDNAGILGIGTTTPLQGSFDTKAQVYHAGGGTDPAARPARAGLALFNTQIIDDTFSGVAFNTYDTDGVPSMGAQIAGMYTSHAAGAVSGELAFVTSDTGTISEKLRLTSSGNVGIGTTSPNALLALDGGNIALNSGWLSNDGGNEGVNINNSGQVGIGIVPSNAKLEVTGNALVTGKLGVNAVGSQDFTVRAAGAQPVIETQKSDGTVTSQWGTTSGSDDLFVDAELSGSDILFRTSGNTTRLAVDGSTGNVGIGTTSPTSKLSVTGTMSVDGLTGSTGAGSLCLTSNNEVVFNSGSDACLPSLRETKHDIETLDVNALDMVSALESVSFEYNQGDGRTRYGFIAEDVADVDALLATYDAEGAISGIDDRSMIAVVVQAMQEMWADVQSLLAWRDEADEEIERLEARIAELEEETGVASGSNETTSFTDDAHGEDETDISAGDHDIPASTDTTASSTDSDLGSDVASSTDHTSASTTDEKSADDTDTASSTDRAETNEETSETETSDASGTDDDQSVKSDATADDENVANDSDITAGATDEESTDAAEQEDPAETEKSTSTSADAV